MRIFDTGRIGTFVLALTFALPTGAWAQQHFTNCLSNNVNDANVVIPTTVPVTHAGGTYTLAHGDEIALVSNDGRCAGMATVDTSKTALSISVADVDSIAGVVEAYESDERLKYRIWRDETDEIVDVSSVSYSCTALSGCESDALFTKDGIYEVSKITTGSNTLPIELDSFEATDTDQSVVLTWRTASEVNNAGFEVQHRRGPDAAWSTLSFVEGAGTTSTPQSYRYKTNRLEYGTHTFRLKHVDQSGTTGTSQALDVELRLDQSYKISDVAPNPVRSSGTMRLTLKNSQHVTVHLYDVLGRRRATLLDRTLDANSTQTLRIEGRHLSSGKYFLRIEGRDFSATRQLTVVK